MEKIWNEMYEAAKSVLNERRISEYVTCGEVSAAVLSKSGKIYTGVCIDTCSTLGICAERNAIFNMITNGEQEIDKVLCILPDGSNGAPCGACRELMVQLMAGNYYDIEIMLDYSTGRFVEDSRGIVDYGFDVYAPQTFVGKSAVMGWLNMWDRNVPSEKYGFAGMLTTARKVTVKDGILYQEPILNCKEKNRVTAYQDHNPKKEVKMFINKTASRWR